MQETPEFAGLTPNTPYTFYARMKATDTHNASGEKSSSQTLTYHAPKLVEGVTEGILGNSQMVSFAAPPIGTKIMVKKAGKSSFSDYTGEFEVSVGDKVEAYVTDDGGVDTYKSAELTFNFVKAYTLTIDGGGAGVLGAGHHAVGATVSINAGTRSGYTFVKWTAESDIITDANSAATTFVMPDGNVTLAATWRQNSSPNTGGGDSTPTTPPATDEPVIKDKNGNTIKPGADGKITMPEGGGADAFY